MGRRLTRSARLWAAAIVLGAVVGFHYALTGLLSLPEPSTPMTVARADLFFGQSLQPGQGRNEVEAWLASRGFRFDSGAYPASTSYASFRRPSDDGRKKDWMDQIGHETVAECAGLEADSVDSFIRVLYPDAERYLFGHTEIMIYLFFDSNDQLLRQWVRAANVGL